MELASMLADEPFSDHPQNPKRKYFHRRPTESGSLRRLNSRKREQEGKMATKLSVTTGARRSSLRPLAITAMLVAGFAITASGASAAQTPGSWTVRPGKTLEVTQMTLLAHDLDTAEVGRSGQARRLRSPR
jgi:hypothetical protein